MGCQKQFGRNYQSKGDNIRPSNQSWKQTALVAGVWLLLNGIIGLLYFAGVLDKGLLIIISLAFSVCDIICILFFCPFQTWFMLNRCCGSCRIYNWDFAMMFTPLIFIPSLYTYSLLGCAIALLLRWEITYRKYPERFSTETNACLDCANLDYIRCFQSISTCKFRFTNKFQNHHPDGSASRVLIGLAIYYPETVAHKLANDLSRSYHASP